jgi:hypothetical protein
MSSTPKTISGIPDPITVSKNQVRIVKSRDMFKDIDYLETQIGRLAKMAREIRAKALLLTTE